MNIIDIAIIFIILAYGLLGAHRGVFKQLVTTLGFILVIILAFYLRKPLAEFLSLHLPFFEFKGAANAGSFNIMLYQAIAFIILILLLQAILNILIKITGVFEKILKATIILGIPSKILGFIAGMLEGLVFAFILVFFLNQPAFKIDVVNESKLANRVLNHTPILSTVSKNMNKTIKDIYALIDDRSNDATLDLKSIESMLDNKLISKDYVKKLIDKDKLNITGIDTVLNKYED